MFAFLVVCCCVLAFGVGCLMFGCFLLVVVSIGRFVRWCVSVLIVISCCCDGSSQLFLIVACCCLLRVGVNVWPSFCCCLLFVLRCCCSLVVFVLFMIVACCCHCSSFCVHLWCGLFVRCRFFFLVVIAVCVCRCVVLDVLCFLSL